MITLIPPSALVQQDTAYEVKWKSEFVKGDDLALSQSTAALNSAIISRTDLAIATRQAADEWSADD